MNHNNEDLAALLGRANELLGILVKTQLGPVLARELEKPENRKLYELTGGDLSVDKIASKVAMSTGKISGLWVRWEELGLIVKAGKRYRRVFP